MNTKRCEGCCQNGVDRCKNEGVNVRVFSGSSGNIAVDEEGWEFVYCKEAIELDMNAGFAVEIKDE